MNDVYFDYAAATPVDNAVLDAMKPFWQKNFYNPSGNSLPAREVRNALTGAREEVAKVLAVKPAEIVFTAGGSEANNLAILGFAKKHPGKEIISTEIEHDSVLKTIQSLASNKIKLAKPNKQGIVTTQSIKKLITKNTLLVSVMMVNNELGTLQPIKNIASLIEAERQRRLDTGNLLPIFFHTDASQAPNYFEVKPNKLGVDLMTLNGGKIYGPKQTGILYIKTGVDVSPVIYGGGQERNIRSGTENVAGFIGFASALTKTAKKSKSEAIRLKQIQKYCFNQLETIAKVRINGSKKLRSPNNVHFTVDGHDNETLMYQLEEKGYICAVGSACSASDEEPSHVLRAIGLSQADARSSLRLSFGRNTTQLQVEKFIKTLKQLIAK